MLASAVPIDVADGFSGRGLIGQGRARAFRRRALAEPAAALAGGILAAACGAAGGTESGAAPGPAAAPVTLTYLSLANGARQDGEKALFDEFKRVAPQTTVEIVPVGPAWADVKTKWEVLQTSGTPPHLAHNGWGGWFDMKLNGTLTELSPFFKRDKLVPDKVFFPTTLEHWSDNGQQWGMPVSVSVDVLACNVGLFEQAGLPLPPADPADRTWTVDKFLDYAQKLTRGETQYGFFGVPSGYDVAGVSSGTWFGQLPWDDQKKKALMSQPDFVKGLQFFKDLRDRYRVSKPLPFREGSVAMQVHVAFRPPFPFKWAAVALPYGGAGRSLSGRQFPNGFQMGRAKETDASWSVLRWLTQPEVNSKMVLINTHVVSPLQDPKASEVTLQAFKSEIGIDGRAYFLQQQYCKTSGYGLLKYAPWGTLSTELNARFNDFMGDKLGANDYAREATTKIDQQIGTLK